MTTNPRPREPERLGDTLAALIKRFRHVDLSIMEQIIERWPSLVGPELAEVCRPEVVRDGVLYVAVPNGAYGQKMRMTAENIISGLSDISAEAPTSLQVTVRG